MNGYYFRFVDLYASCADVAYATPAAGDPLYLQPIACIVEHLARFTCNTLPASATISHVSISSRQLLRNVLNNCRVNGGYSSANLYYLFGSSGSVGRGAILRSSTLPAFTQATGSGTTALKNAFLSGFNPYTVSDLLSAEIPANAPISAATIAAFMSDIENCKYALGHGTYDSSTYDYAYAISGGNVVRNISSFQVQSRSFVSASADGRIVIPVRVSYRRNPGDTYTYVYGWLTFNAGDSGAAMAAPAMSALGLDSSCDVIVLNLIGDGKCLRFITHTFDLF